MERQVAVPEPEPGLAAQLPEHARSLEPLLHEPDLCVAYGAALRGGTHGTRYYCPLRTANGRLADTEACLELHLTSPANTRDVHYQAAGVVRLHPGGGAGAGESSARAQPATPNSPFSEGGSVRVRSLASGLVEEAFLDERVVNLARAGRGQDADLRAALTVSSILGLVVARHFLELEALQHLTDDQIQRVVRPWLRAASSG